MKIQLGHIVRYSGTGDFYCFGGGRPPTLMKVAFVDYSFDPPHVTAYAISPTSGLATSRICKLYGNWEFVREQMFED